MIDQIEFTIITSFLMNVFGPFLQWLLVGVLASGIIASIFYIFLDLLKWLTRERG